MSDLPPPRWNLAVVAMRWRHLFWLLPLAAVAIGGYLEWRGYQKGRFAYAIIELRPPSPPGTTAPGLACPFPVMDSAAAGSVVLSDSVLGDACYDMNYLDPRDQVHAHVLKLRPRVSCEQIPGTTQFMILVAGTASPLNVELCRFITDRAEAKFNRLYNQAEADAEARDVDRISLSETDIALMKAQGENEASMKRAIYETRHGRWGRSPLLVGAKVITWPSVPPPPAWRELVDPAQRLAVWIGAAIAVAALAAYLFEWIFPAKRGRGMDEAKTAAANTLPVAAE